MLKSNFFCLSLVLSKNRPNAKLLVVLLTFLGTPFIFAQTSQTIQERKLNVPYNTSHNIHLALDTISTNHTEIRFELARKPKFGYLTINGPNATYKPKENYIGIDFFSYILHLSPKENILVNVKILIGAPNPSLLSNSYDSTPMNHHKALLDTLFQPQKEEIVILPTTNTPKPKTNLTIKKLPFVKKSNLELQAIFFLGTDCPISQKYIAELKNLYKKYGHILNFYGIVPSNYSTKQIRLFKKNYAIPFKVLRDKNNEYVKEFGATVTPEVYLINTNGTIYYNGAIDNWFYELGKNRRVVTAHYLNDAIKAVLSGEKVKIDQTSVIGCFIELQL